MATSTDGPADPRAHPEDDEVVPGRAPTASPLLPLPDPTATATPHPLSIEWLRKRTFSSALLVVEEDLAAGAGYARSVVSYNSEGNKLYALLTVPSGTAPPNGWPVVVFNHGYIPPAQYRTTERYVAYVDAFARNGYMVIKPDYRGHGQSEGEARGGYGNQGYTVDVLNALAAVRRHPEADPARVGMWGHSMGGHITLRSMVTTDTIKAGVIWAGVVVSYPDLMDRWHRPWSASGSATPRPGRRWRTDLMAEFGTPEENPAFWDSISANSFVTDLSGPIQLHHGTDDQSVPIAFSETLHQQLLDAGIGSEFYRYPGADHNISQALSQALRRSVEFFDVHVKVISND